MLQQIKDLEIQLSRRDITQRTRDFLKLQLSKAKENASTDDEAAIEELRIMSAFAAGRKENRLAQRAGLNEWELPSRFADYAMVECQKLDKLKGTFEYQKYQWNEIVQKLDMDVRDYKNWHSKCSSEPTIAGPSRPIRDSLIEAMTILDEKNHEQMFWEIRLYVARNEKMHSGILDLRGSDCTS